jgi:hypothetical protein
LVEPSTATALRLDPEDEWRIVYKELGVLAGTCSAMSETNRDYNNDEINRERMLAELVAESGFLRASQTELAVLRAPSEPVETYLSRLEDPISVLDDVLASGEQAVVKNDLEVWSSVGEACIEIWDLYASIDADALAAGLSEESQLLFSMAAYDAEMEVNESTQDGRTAADVPTPVGVAQPAAPTGDQEQLMEAWLPAYFQGALLSETCTTAYDTHASLAQGVIDLDRALAELEAEGSFVEVVLQGVASTSPPNDVVARHILEIETKATALADWIEPEDDDIGTDAALDTIEAICNSLMARMDGIIADARASGLSDASLEALGNDPELNEMIQDLYDLTIYSR